MSRTIQITTSSVERTFAYPASQGSFANWSTKRVELTGTDGARSGSVDTSLDGPLWYVFIGEDPPTSWNDYRWYADFSQVDSIESATADIPKFGDTQRWTNPTESLDVSVTRVL